MFIRLNNFNFMYFMYFTSFIFLKLDLSLTTNLLNKLALLIIIIKNNKIININSLINNKKRLKNL